MDMTVERIDRTVIELPFRDRLQPHMHRQLPHWKYFDVIELELACGAVGHGENLEYYGWGSVTDDDVRRAIGSPAPELLWDDDLGALQIALFDSVARAMDVPVSELLGDRKRDRVPVGWWCIDMPPDGWLAECERAIEEGYTTAKLKGRPWFDLGEAIERLRSELPDWFTLSIDFNMTMVDADRALPVLEDLDQYPGIELFESPIHQTDVAGNRRLVRSLDTDVGLHNGRPDELTQLQTGIAEKFVFGTGGPSQIRRETGMASTTGTPFWLQNLGPLTAVFWAHVAATMPGNTMPNVFCDHLYAESPLDGELSVTDGELAVPEGPGLGYEFDFDVVDRYAVERPTEQPSPDRLIVTEWPDHEPIYFATGEQMQEMAQRGEMPYFESGASTRLVPDDDSEWWSRLHEQSLDGPVVGGI